MVDSRDEAGSVFGLEAEDEVADEEGFLAEDF